MIHINKDFSKIPASLTSETTNERRREIIKLKKFQTQGIYSSRYKKEDVKTALSNLYRNKCAFCEQKIERFDVEHFRPKSIYYWLAYSWDNLLVACPVCNGNKTNHFKLIKKRVEFDDADYKNIHHLAEKYNQLEENLFFHPEIENPEDDLDFKEDGTISSDNQKLCYTIETCKLNRPYLIERRKRIIDNFLQQQNEIYLQYLSTKEEALLYEIKALRKLFKKEALDKENEFLAFRRKMVKNFSL